MRQITLALLLLCSCGMAWGQNTSIQVNPDGTHTTIFNNGNTSTQVNPDGTHTTIFNHGNTSTQINPDGTHTTILHHGNTSTKVNPDGTHSTIFHHGNTSTQVNPDGTHTVTYQPENVVTKVQAVGSAGPNEQAMPTGVKSYIDTAAKVQSDGSLIIRYPNGVVIKVQPNGERVLLKE